MIERRCRNPVNVCMATEMPVADYGQGMGQGGHFPGMGSDVLLNGISHQPPALDPAQAGDIGKKMADNTTHQSQSCFIKVDNFFIQIREFTVLL